MSNNNNYNKYESVFLLHALGDTIGFKNGEWEFNYYDVEKRMELDYVNELIYEFIHLGGVNGINLKKWLVSDDTLFHMAIGKALLKFKGQLTDKFIADVKTNMDIINEQMKKESKKGINRYIGITTKKSIDSFSDDFDARNDKYNDFAGGNGCAMRTHIIGLCLSGKDKRDELIDVSIVTSQLTHNNAIGYLGGFVSALFTAFAIEEVPIIEWPFKLVEYLNTKKVKSFLDVNNLEQSYDHRTFLLKWQKYIDTRFLDGKPIQAKTFHNPLFRIKYFHDNFFKGTSSLEIGGSGYLCTIMAYDALLESNGNWEKLIFYSMLHPGDSDTIGAVAGGWYGAKYGMGDVPENMLKHLEYKKELKELADDLSKRFQ